MKLLVVGAGIAGSCVARKARAEGHHVTVQADPLRPAAAKAALCVINPSWFKGEDKHHANEALRWYQSLGALTAVHAMYSNYKAPDEVFPRPGYFAVDPSQVLVEPDIAEPYLTRPDGYDQVILCLGAHADVPGKRTWGATTVIDAEGPPLRAHLARPREVLFAVSHRGTSVRFGSSSGATLDAALARQYALNDRARAAGLAPAGPREVLVGVRLLPPIGRTAGNVGVRDGALAVQGFGRVGFSLAPARAAEILDRL